MEQNTTLLYFVAGANVNAVQENGETALHIAARHGRFKIVSFLLQDGADPTYLSKVSELYLRSVIF